ncbi:MAG TPA: LacI family DNA-binding transcriptional regulator [Tenuifilaceae bacterium]|nr:LacI family DNA-binding transcriptional regulator [Tenuifilaceae bacterium]HPE17175.1 LacI family DNA-binding transcriptional regulator [Tenuifilaceae bacterium]HPJ44777.1 LacI family DNA-binding transcriptional regulator [Tenuifilaceae bacterium]HRX67574.1 LacI family DNA-binding transcriptional regulator [Tenuifilaceae bacterium]
MAKKVSIADIAKSLGVSVTLVSLVINGKGDSHGISAETQKKVLKKIKELNYSPNVLARGFRTGKTNTIGLIVSDISNRFYSRIARKVEDYAWIHGYSVVICSTDESEEKEKKQINLLLDRKVDGIIVSSSLENAEQFNKLTENNFPHVLIDRTFENSKSPTVSVDNFGGAQLAARHIISQGFTKIAMMCISPEHISTINQRVMGFVSALAEKKIEIPNEWRIQIPYNNIEKSVKENLQKLYQKGEMPEAIFTMNNNLTTNCLMCLRKLSLEIPNDIALIGFDDLQYFEFTQPSISAIDQPVEKIGEEAFDLLLKQIEKKGIAPEDRTVILPVDLIIRESSIKQK